MEAEVRVTRYDVSCLPADHTWYRYLVIHVVWRGGDRWAVIQPWDPPLCLGSDGEWDCEPLPSNRTKEWIDTHRFGLDTALRLAREHAPKVTVNGYTVADLLAKDGEG